MLDLDEVAGDDVAAVLAAARRAITERDARIAEHEAKLAEREAENATQAAMLEKQASQYEALRAAYMELELELKLLKRRIFIAKAERVDTAQLQLEFEELTKKLEALSGLLGQDETEPETTDPDPDEEGEPDPAPDDDNQPPAPPPKPRPKGRRKLAEMDLPQETVELTDPTMEKLIEEGKARRMAPEVSYKIGRKPAEFYKLEVRRVTYATCPDEKNGRSEIYTTEVPPELIPRCLAAPSMLAEIVTDKFNKGLPLYRQEQCLGFESFPIDRGTMSRWLDLLGRKFHVTIVGAMDGHARGNAFCIATDATGFPVQPGPLDGGPRRSCLKGHYFVRIADRDHIIFDFTKRHRTQDVRALFKGYSGYIQADACSVYDALFRPAKPGDPDDDGCERDEAGCWSHCRRKFFEAAFAKLVIGREGLVRLSKIFEVDEKTCRAGKPPPSTIKRRREQHLAPLIDEFIEFAKDAYEREKTRRGPARTALGYVVRQEGPLRAVLRDGRIRLDNNRSERELRKVVRIRDACLFVGSDAHGVSAAAHLTLIASAKLHRLDPRQYIRDIIRVLPFWPEDRYLELAPLYWSETRARLDPAELQAEVGWITVPPARPTDSGEEPAAQ